MAGRRRRMGKSAYRMTARRKSALRKAQLISARKRRKGSAIKGGILAGGALALGVYGGVRYSGQIKDVASSVKRTLSFNTPNNSAQRAALAQDRNVLNNGATNAQAARQAAPVNSPNLGNTTTPKPNNNTGKPGIGFGSVKPAKPGRTAKVKPLPTAESIIDPQKPTRSPFPADMTPSIEQVMNRLKRTDPKSVTRDDVKVISKLWYEEKLRTSGRKIPGLYSKSVGNVGLYMNILDAFGLETEKAEKNRLQGKA